MIILDSDHVTLLGYAGPEAQRIRRRYDALEPGGKLVTTVISYEEQTRGWLAVLSKARELNQQIIQYEKLIAHLRFFEKFEVLHFDILAAIQFQHLRTMKLRIGTMDLKIAAIALAFDATVFTRNLRDFSRVPGLRVEDGAK